MERTERSHGTSAAGASRPRPRSRRWASFVADEAPRGRVARGLHEEENPRHRVPVECDAQTLLIHLSHADGSGWTTIAVDRATRQWAVPQAPWQIDAASGAYTKLYESNAPEDVAVSRSRRRSSS
jgi:hypothetical protein